MSVTKHLMHEINKHCVQKFNSYVIVNILRMDYKDQSLKAVQLNNRCSIPEFHKTYRY